MFLTVTDVRASTVLVIVMNKVDISECFNPDCVPRLYDSHGTRFFFLIDNAVKNFLDMSNE